MYLTAGKVDPKNVFSSWKGRSGKFIRTFGLNTKRNNNEWKVSWKSIKRYISTAINRPGIEYEKCQQGKCDLDHVEADSLNGTFEKQKPFSRTNIVDYVFNEDTETVDLIHEVNDDEFFEKIKSGEIQYVSAMIWPATGGYDIHGRGRADLPIVDAEHWQFVHLAFLRDNPAYGKDTAKVKTVCEGENCQIQMLTSKQINFDTDQQEFPLLFRHQRELHLVSASQEVQNIIEQNKKDGIEINSDTLTNAYDRCKESNLENSPFKACECKFNRAKMTETQIQDLEIKLKASESEKEEMKSKLKSSEEEKKEMESKLKSKSSAKYSKLFAAESDEDSKKMYAKLKASTDDEEELKAMDEGMEDSHKARKSASEDPEKQAMKSSLLSMQAKFAKPMIEGLVSIRKDKMPEAELTEFRKALTSKKYEDIEKQYEDEAYLINGLPSKEVPIVQTAAPKQFDFNGGASETGLTSKSLEEISGEVLQ